MIRLAHFLILLFISFGAYSQDTLFVNKHNFSSIVRNVFEAENTVYVRTDKHLYRLNSESQWQRVDLIFDKPYVFFNEGFYDSDFIPHTRIIKVENMADMIPQDNYNDPTAVRLNNKLYLSVGGSLFEYLINPNYTRSYKGRSIRDVYIDDSVKIVSTYSGIFINDSIKAYEPGYANGGTYIVSNQYLLCADNLYQLDYGYSFRKVEFGDLTKTGKFRKVIDFLGQTYFQNTVSINRFDSLAGMILIHDGFEYLDIEKVDSSLWFCTTKGEVFEYVEGKVAERFNFQTAVNDIYSHRSDLYFATDKGLFSSKSDNYSSLKKLNDLPNVVGVLIDEFNTIWIATENGMHIMPSNVGDPLPFIENVEFNRDAFQIWSTMVYAGSVNGLYEISTYLTKKEYLPGLEQRPEKSFFSVYSTEIVIIIVGSIVLLLFGQKIYKKRFRDQSLKEEQELTLEVIEQLIRRNSINTVETLADALGTNTVQLNRLFKNFETTPGKFLKKVRLDLAREMLDANKPMSEVARKIGYSAGFVRQNLKNK